jgi:Trk K+ transport system NAD-binding subunit
VPPLSRLAARRDHLVVCGDDTLAARVIEELTTTYGEEVTVLLRSREQDQGPRIARLPKARIIERADLDASAFTAAGVQSARALALLRQDDLGVSVACVDKSENAAGVAMARRLGLRVVIGETHREDVLRAAGVTTCQALVSVTNSDSVNLETALHARALAGEIRIVLRLGNDDLAARVERSVGHTISRSVSYLAAPTFAAAMLEHQVLRTIAVGRHVLLIADLGVGAGSELDGTAVQAVHQTGLVRVLAVQPAGGGPVNWSPAGNLRLGAQDRLYVIATRAGLSRVLARSAPPG